MTSVYASTTFEWFQTLSQLHLSGKVAFWQPTPANPRQVWPGERWFFKQLHKPVILGWGTFVGWEKLSVGQLYSKYGTASGYRSLGELRTALDALSKSISSTNTQIGNVILDEFTALQSPIPIRELGLEDLSARFRYVEDDGELIQRMLGISTLVPTVTNIQPVAPINSSEATVGPIPSDWNAVVSHPTTGEAFTYAIRFGSHNIWKVGWARNVDRRVKAINAHIPTEIVPDIWELKLTQCWGDAKHAYEMEQLVLKELGQHRGFGERVTCPENALLEGWASAFQKAKSKLGT